MNYRHIYHAGNFADVMKHLALTLVLDHMKKKDTPFCVVDAHGGIGLYDLSSEQAQKTDEWEDGIGRFADETDFPADFAAYFNLVKDDLGRKHYPGSPLLASRLLRPQDRLIANELHPEDVVTLRRNLPQFINTHITNLDAYACIRGQIPPKEKRGVILIDPPFEKTDEFETLIKQMGEWKKRFPLGIFILWYPIKSHLMVDALKEAAAELGLRRTWCVETLKFPRDRRECFNGCGIIIWNTPYQIPERIEALLPLLQDKMGLYACDSQWLTEE